jgi:hypothetical protein
MRSASLSVALAALLASPNLSWSAEPASACAACNEGSCATCETTAAPKSTIKKSGSWLIEETDNFCICRPVGYKMKDGLAASFEALRSELLGTWLPESAKTSWQPKCHIVVHSRFESYLKEVGPGGRQTTGSSLIDFDKDQVVMRRIDLRGDRADWFAEALAHELTHVVLADRFVRIPIPHWADEGMAILADTAGKRRLHGKDLASAVARGGEFRLAELLTMENYPHPSRMGTFYGQSASLVEFLTKLGSKQQLVDFVDQATVKGYDKALRNVYAITGVGSLEQQWQRHLRGQPMREAVSKASPPAGPSTGDLATSQATSASSDMPVVVASAME